MKRIMPVLLSIIMTVSVIAAPVRAEEIVSDAEAIDAIIEDLNVYEEEYLIVYEETDVEDAVSEEPSVPDEDGLAFGATDDSADYVVDYDGLIAALDSVPDGGVVYIAKDFELTGDVVIPDKTVTIAGYEGTFTLKRSNYSGILFVVPVGSGLKLSNIVIDASGDSVDSVIFNKGDFILDVGAVIKNNRVTVNKVGDGNGVGVYNVGTFTLNGGEISGNKTTNKNNVGSFGGGVFNLGTFKMIDGIISDNVATFGAGVYNHGVFEMNGGEISKNAARSVFSILVSEGKGGGVFSDYQFSVSNGVISNNTALYDGGGVFVLTDTLATSSIAVNVAKRVPQNLLDDAGYRAELPFFALNSGSISYNEAGRTGGGIALSNFTNDGTITVAGGEIVKNKALSGASGIYDTATKSLSALSINGGDIRDNYSTRSLTPAIAANYINVSGAAQLSSKNAYYVYSGLIVTGELSPEAYIEIDGKRYLTAVSSAVVASARDYDITESDLARFGVSSDAYTLSLANNKIYVGKSSEAIVAPRFSEQIKPIELTLDKITIIQLNASGSKPITYSVTEGALPKGLAVLGGVITGLPKETGVFDVVIKAENAAGNDFALLTFEVDALQLYKITPAIDEGGSISGIPAGKLERGTVVDLVADAEPGYIFLKWQVNPIAAYTADGNKLKLTVPSYNVEVKAVFVKDEKPNTPLGLKASYVAGTSLTLTWDAVETASGYDVALGDKILAADLNTLAISGLSANTEYTFKVRAKNQSGESDWSEPISVTTKAVTGTSDIKGALESLLAALLQVLRGLFGERL
jgi:hypothetical protein